MRKHQGTRMFAGVLSCALALSLLPAAASAAEPEPVYQGDGYYITVELYGNQDLRVMTSEPFSEGLIRFTNENNAYGFADQEGNVVLSPEELEASGYQVDAWFGYFSSGLCPVSVEQPDGSLKKGYINKQGELVIPAVYARADMFQGSWASVVKDPGVEAQIIDTAGNVVVDCTVEEYHHWLISDDLYAFRNSSIPYSLIVKDRSGREVAALTADMFDPSNLRIAVSLKGTFSEGYLPIEADGKSLVVDEDWNVVWSDPDYEIKDIGVQSWYEEGVHSGLILVYTPFTNFCVVNVETGEFVIPPEDELETIYDNFSDGLATVRKNKEFGVVDTEGNYVIPVGEFGYDCYIGPFNEGLAMASIDGQYYLLEKHEGTWSGQGQPEEEGYEYGQVPDCPKLQATGTCTGSFTMNDSEGQLRTVYVFPAGTTFSTVEPQWDFITQVKELATGEILYDAAEMTPGVAYEIKVTDTWGPVVYAYVQVGGSAQPEQPATVAGFTDVAADAWYASFVKTVAEKGLFSGKGNGIFGPNDSMTYAEFLVVLSQFSGETVTPVEGGAWYEGYVNWAQPLIPAGMAEGFNPNAPITRQDMAALFGTFLNAYDYSAEPVNQDEPAFADAASIADYADSGVELCYQLGIMSGKDNNRFDPAGTTTRAEVAVTMTQMARVMGR